MASAIQRYLLAPRTPNTAAGFIDDNFAVVDLRRNRRGFSLVSSAVTQLTPGVVTPGFDSPNIQDEQEMAEIVLQTVEASGLSKKKRWSIALPEGVVRTLIVTLESKPGSRQELTEVLAWKIERVIAVPANELRISRQRLSPLGGQERYLIAAARESVISQYESLFFGIGWEAGLLLPRHLGEAQWLTWDRAPGDKMLVSANRGGFTALVVQKNEPALIRSYSCDLESRPDEIHRFALYYKDRLDQTEGSGANLSSLLVLGDIEVAEAQQAIGDALDAHPHALTASEFGFDLANEPIRFDHLAGAAGLATLAWQ